MRSWVKIIVHNECSKHAKGTTFSFIIPSSLLASRSQDSDILPQINPTNRVCMCTNARILKLKEKEKEKKHGQFIAVEKCVIIPQHFCTSILCPEACKMPQFKIDSRLSFQSMQPRNFARENDLDVPH